MNITDKIILSLNRIQENTELFAPDIGGDLNLSQVHCIAVIGNIEDANVTKISNELKMTTGAITKICKKLFNHGFVEKFQYAVNNKEVYYTLTESGQKIYEIHRKLHDKIYKDKKSIIAKYSDDEKAVILKFLNDISTFVDNAFADTGKDADDN